MLGYNTLRAAQSSLALLRPSTVSLRLPPMCGIAVVLDAQTLSCTELAWDDTACHCMWAKRDRLTVTLNFSHHSTESEGKLGWWTRYPPNGIEGVLIMKDGIRRTGRLSRYVATFHAKQGFIHFQMTSAVLALDDDHGATTFSDLTDSLRIHQTPVSRLRAHNDTEYHDSYAEQVPQPIDVADSRWPVSIISRRDSFVVTPVTHDPMEKGGKLSVRYGEYLIKYMCFVYCPLSSWKDRISQIHAKRTST